MELFVNSLQRKGYNIFITESNAKLLSKELATHLTGRHISLEIFPFSFREYLKYLKFSPNIYLTKDVSKVKDFFKRISRNWWISACLQIGKKIFS